MFTDQRARELQCRISATTDRGERVSLLNELSGRIRMEQPRLALRYAAQALRLARSIGKTKNDPAPFHNLSHLTGNVVKANAYGDYYFLWCLERVGVIYDVNQIGGKDWYGWGSDVIVQNQNPGGFWQDKHGDVCDTCFAILFLTRANLAKDLTESIRTRGGKAAIP